MFHTVVAVDSRDAWRAPIAGFISDFLNIGFDPACGILLLGLHEDYGVPHEIIMPTILISSGLILSLCPAVEWISIRIGSKASVLTSTVLSSLSLILLFLVPITGISVAILLGVVIGASRSFSHFVVTKFTTASFKKRRGVAVSVQKAGSSAGVFVLPPIYALMLDFYGVRISALLAGAIFLHLLIVCALIPSVVIDNETGRRVTPLPKWRCCRQSEESRGGGREDKEDELVNKNVGMMTEPLPVKHWYLFFACSVLVINLVAAITAKNVLALYADEFGLSTYMIAAVLSTRGGIDAVVRSLNGFIFDKAGNRGKLLILATMQSIGAAGLFFLLLSPGNPLTVMFIYVVSFAVSDPFLMTGWMQVVAFVSGNFYMGRVMSAVMMVNGVTIVSTSFGFGALRYAFGTYRPVYYFITCCISMSAFAFLLLAIIFPQCTKERPVSKQKSSSMT